MSVASVKPAGASSAIRPHGTRAATRPVIAGSRSSCATASKTGSLSSRRSRLGQRLCFESRQQTRQIADGAACLPRASSATSGFFFCGMIELPVDHAVRQCDVPGFRCAQMMISSLRRDKSTAIIVNTNSASAAKSRDDVASIEFSGRRENPEIGRDRSRVQTQRRTGQGPGPVRGHRGPAVRIGEAVDITQQRLGVREQMVRQQHRLCGLQGASYRASPHRDGPRPDR